MTDKYYVILIKLLQEKVERLEIENNTLKREIKKLRKSVTKEGEL